MKCPKCNATTKVINTGIEHSNLNIAKRGIKVPEGMDAIHDNFRLRRIKCNNCEFRFNSIELTCDDYEKLRNKFRVELKNQITNIIKEN